MLFTILAPSLAMAATVTVGPDGDYATISSAISVSTDGDTIEVSPGTYEESINLGLKDVTVVSTEGWEVTSITGDGRTATVSISDEATTSSRLSGFTLSNTSTRCIRIEGGTPQLDNLNLSGCGSDTMARAGGILILGGSSSIANTIVENAIAESGSGLHCEDAELTVTDSEFNGNQATTGNGGALRLLRCNASLSNVTIDGNTAAQDGGGISASSSTVSADIGTVFSNNQSLYGSGGGISVESADSLTIDNVQFDGNSARDFGAGAYLNNVSDSAIENSVFSGNTLAASTSSGGALFAQSSTVDLSSVTLENNASGAFGGGISAIDSRLNANTMDAHYNGTNGLGGVLYASNTSVEISDSNLQWNDGLSGGGGIHANDSTLTLTGGTVDSNASTGGSGGGLFLTESVAFIDGAWIRGNTAQVGGAVLVNGEGTLELMRSVVQENRATFNAGGIHASGTLSVTIWSNDFIGNETLTSETAAHLRLAVNGVDLRNNNLTQGINGSAVTLIDAESTDATIRHNNAWGNEGGDYVGMGLITGMDGNIGMDPLFVEVSVDGDFSNDDLYLQHDSPCIGAGDPETATPSIPEPDIGAFGLTAIPSIDEDGDGYPPEAGGDCDDGDPTVHPGTDELCDGVDNNCDGYVDEGCPEDTGSIDDTGEASDDTGTFDPDTGTEAPPDEQRDETENLPSAETDQLYEIRGTGCRCSTQRSHPSGLFGLGVSLLLFAFRRRQA